QLQHAADTPGGGIEVISHGAEHAIGCSRTPARWSSAAGFVPLLASGEAGRPLPADIRQRHVLIVCSRESRVTAIGGIRALAMISPRRHLVVALGLEQGRTDAVEAEPECDAGGWAVAPALTARERRGGGGR